jgi:CheY-like chemotaxis protein
MKHILVVDDDKLVAASLALRIGLQVKDARIHTAGDGREAMEILNFTSVDVLMTDLQMPVMNGYELIAYCRKNLPSLPLFAMSGALTPEVKRQLQTLGVTACVDKPFDFDEIALRVTDALDHIP